MMTEHQEDIQDEVFEAIHYHFLKLESDGLNYDYKESVSSLVNSIDNLISDLQKLKNKL